jgi:hypothetical protein
MRTRLRPKYSDEELAKIYDHVYDHTRWVEHQTRITWTIRRLQHFIDLRPEITRVVDLSCGDGAILNGLNVPSKVFGDIVMAPHLTIGAVLAEISVKYTQGDLLVCSETLEHLDDPDEFLRNAQENFKFIAITTPLGETNDHNWEHYWGWDLIGVNDMLQATQWYPLVEETLPLEHYTYQFWIARS